MFEHRNIANQDATGGSNKALGIVFAVVFAIIGLWPLVYGNEPRLWSLAVAVMFMGLALALPAILTPLNILWTKFGLLLHKIMNPLILGAVFFLVVTPMALLMRLLGKKPLALKRSGQASYWILRNPPGPAPESFKNQF